MMGAIDPTNLRVMDVTTVVGVHAKATVVQPENADEVTLHVVRGLRIDVVTLDRF